ncbi:MAG: protein kinase [Acidobacteriaceae bacterium]|nr:protein kinase [Acidobacteriaceae bacterium]MBV9779767.1 protein kinase [Acidobacteriaceae bacterium]
MRHISKAMSVAQDSGNHLDWMSLQGTTLEGGYVLEQCLGADERSIIFKAQATGEQNAPAIVKMYRAGLRAAEEQIALWEEIRKLEHPNLLQIFATGRATMHREELVYVVVERADETLADVLAERPLSADEAGEALVSVCRGLEQLHAAGFVHGHLAPAQILAVGNAIKLSTEGVRRAESAPDIEVSEAKYRAPESAGANITAEADVWCLGATLFRALTQKDCGTDCRAETARLPVPLSTIIQRCLYKSPEARCTVADAMQLYERRWRALGAAAGANGEAATMLVSGASSATADVREPARIALASVSEVQPEPARTRVTAPYWRIWAYLAAGLVLVVALIWLARPKRNAAPKPTGPAIATPRTSSAATSASQQPSSSGAVQRQPKAEFTRQLAGQATQKPTPDQTHFVQGPVWRVVTYTYSSEANAEKQVHTINRKHPNLKAEVFSPNGTAGPYLVIVGGQMNRESAQAVRQRAIRAGLPRDSYIQNYRQ